MPILDYISEMQTFSLRLRLKEANEKQMTKCDVKPHYKLPSLGLVTY